MKTFLIIAGVVVFIVLLLGFLIYKACKILDKAINEDRHHE